MLATSSGGRGVPSAQAAGWALPCAADVDSLRTWLRVVVEEDEVRPELIVSPDDPHRYLDRPLPPVQLVRVDEHAVPLPMLAIVSLDHATARFGDASGAVEDVRALDDVVGRAAASILSPSGGVCGLGRCAFFHPVVLLVGEAERWAHVTALVEALAKVGFLEVDFAFEVRSAAEPPASGPALARAIEIASDSHEMPWRRELAAGRELELANPSCSQVARPLQEAASTTTNPLARRMELVERAADAVEACGCRVDMDAIQAFVWTRYGRHRGTTTATHELRIVSRDRAKDADEVVHELSAPATATWRDVHARVIAASSWPGPVFVAATR